MSSGKTVEKVICCFTDCNNEATDYPVYDEDGENRACVDCIDKYEMSDEPLQTEEEDDDPSCSTCGGSGGGDYPGIYCQMCSGSGVEGGRRRRYEPDPESYWADRRERRGGW